LHHYMGDVDGTVGAWGFARGGMGAVADALAASFQSFGGEIKNDAEVGKILVKNGKARGVALANGDEYYADTVVSNLDPKRTFLKIMDEKDLPEDIVRKARNFKIRGSSGKLNIALDGLPTFTGIPKNSPLLHTDMHILDSMERMEKAYDDWKAETWSKDPYVDMLIPTQIDPTMAPPGKHMMTVFVQYAPPRIDGAEWTDADRDRFGKNVIDQIAKYSPDFKDLILHCEVRTPREIEDEVGLTEGNIFMGELTFDQLFPVGIVLVYWKRCQSDGAKTLASRSITDTPIQPFPPRRMYICISPTIFFFEIVPPAYCMTCSSVNISMTRLTSLIERGRKASLFVVS